jgi:Neutral/alkaline non-lysosomal ceramidase, N-terminal
MEQKSRTSAKAAGAEFSAGWARCEYVPPVGAPMPGYIARKNVSVGQAGPLSVRALVLQQGKVRVAILVADILLISNRWAGRLRPRLGKIAAVPEENIIVAATHTHSGPLIDTAPFALLRSIRPGSPSALAVMRRVEACMARALKSAAGSMNPATAEIARIQVRGVATDRNDAARVTSQPMSLLRFRSRDGRAIFAIYGCHSTVLGPDNALFSGDLHGEIASRIEQEVDVALMGTGAAANISTRFTRRGQTFEEVQRLASLVHKQARRARFHSLSIESFSVRAQKLRLPIRNLKQAQRTAPPKAGRLAVVEKEGRKVLAHLRNSPEFRRKSVPIPFAQVSLGGISIVALPFEIFSDTGDFFWESARAVVLGYANGYWGYLPSPAAPQGSYEALSSPYDERADAILRNAISPP